MTQKNRPAISVDITKPADITGAGTIRVATTKWDPTKGALEAQLLIEQQVKEQHLKEMELHNADPVIQRLNKLESSMESLKRKVAKLEKESKSNG